MLHDGVGASVYLDAIEHNERETAERFKYIPIQILLMLRFFFTSLPVSLKRIRLEEML